MAEYSDYKDSGIPWIGRIPSHWITRRAKFIFDRHKRPVRPNDEIVTCFRDGVVTLRKNRRESGFTNALMEFGYQGIRKGDLIVHQMDAFAGSIGVSDSDGKSTPVYTVCTMRNDDSITWYYAFLLRVMAKTDFIQSLSRGIRERSTAFGYDIMGNLLLPIPSKEEQEAIVAYLDKVTADIDKAIAAKERIIASLEERRKIIITHAVTHGINPDAPMKDSDIDWLGEIPAHWESYPVRHFFDFRNGYTPSKANNSFWTNGTIPWFRMEDIRKSGRFLDKAIQYITPSALNNGGTFEAGSYILAICTASIGEHAMLIADSLANQQFANLKIRKSLSDRTDAMFIFYYLYVLGQYCKDTANTTTFQYADMTQVKNFLVPLPSLDEQHEIVKYLEYNTKGIDTAIAQQKRLIDLLRERKNIIINETVTGKVKVI